MTTNIKTNERWNKSGWQECTAVRADIKLNRGRCSDVFRVAGGPCRIICMFMEITEAVPATACNMAWVFHSDTGGRRTIGADVDIQSAALGDFVVSELDGSALVKPTTATGLIHGYWYETATANGTIVTEGGIDITLSDMTLTSGKGTLWVYYKPLMFNACVYSGEMHTSTTSSSTTSSTTSSTSSTSSTTSTSSSTSSSSSTTSSTSSSTSSSSTTSSTSSTTSSSSSTASSTSSTSSTASSTTSSTSSTSSTTSSTASSTSSTSSTASTTSSTSSTASSTSSTSSTTTTTTTGP